MKLGESIKGYQIVSEPTNANGGKCMWAFARKDGRDYFIKRFLEPKRPREGSTASARSRQTRLVVCQEFEDRHRTIMERLRPDAIGGGNLVLATEFFHEGSTYYKVTDRIDTSTLEKPQSLDPRHKSILLKTLANSLKLLHDIDVVHGDLKPANVLVQKRDGNAFYTAKLIDFDDSYVSAQPPDRQDVAGDSLYGAPEWRRYVQDDENTGPEDLTTAVDIFALGLITHYYVTGVPPRHDDRFGSPADAVNAGVELGMDDRLTDSMQGLIRAMTSRAPGRRPRMAAYLKALKDPEVCALRRKRPVRPGTTKPGVEPSAPATTGPGTADGGPGEPRTSRLRTNLRGGSGPRTPTTPVPAPESAGTPDPVPPPTAEPESAPAAEKPPAGRTSRVRINLGNRRKD
ncbi:protein kinase domain-containing protein [Streptomyces botrytidirepellens]|uniref:Serine/threonine protein kinase n=1 Tax=Streptomyces botrytidirepellens TaxID=2486417 RepID=A0A3M8VUE0_9ACTN|nr:protein kinase [Streptomyces botrytidirepellens]RNG20061.1 serine/threonine protein kinase [Streptomyces botrytidirepellens]